MNVLISLLSITILLGCKSTESQNISVSKTQILINAGHINTDISQNPVGLCVSYPTDDDKYFPDRNRSLADALNSINVGTLRFPMGTLADNYMWHKPSVYKNAVNGLKPCVSSKLISPATWDWCTDADGNITSNSLDFDEFIDLCKKTGSEPIIMVNAWGHLQKGSNFTYEEMKTNAVEWVRYSNVIRKYNVKYWEIGNELSVAVNHSLITPDEYIKLFKDFALAMKAVDPSIKIGLGAGFNYFEEVLFETLQIADFIVPHQYQSLKSYNDYRLLTSAPLLKQIDAANTAISKCPEEYREKIEMLITEFSSFSPQESWKLPNGETDQINDLGKSMVTFEMIVSALNQYENISYMHFWVTHNPFSLKGYGNKYSNAFDKYLNTLPQGNALKMFNLFRKNKMVDAVSTSNVIRAYASYSKNPEELSIYLINKDYENIEVEVQINNTKDLWQNELWTYTGANNNPGDTITVIQKMSAVDIKENKFKVTLPPVSISTINFTQVENF